MSNPIPAPTSSQVATNDPETGYLPFAILAGQRFRIISAVLAWVIGTTYAPLCATSIWTPVSGIHPSPFRYRIEVETAPGVWSTVIDRSASTDDLLIDYRECMPTLAHRARLVIVGRPPGIQPAVVEFTVFGITAR